MNQLRPKLFSVMKNYTKEQAIKDVIAGIIVAIIALPLSIALGIASGVTPNEGIYTAIIAGFIISFLGGSRVQIAGPTAAFATIVAGIKAENGMDGLIWATIIAGIILMIMGFCRLGSLIRFIPYTITEGFTLGIAITLLIGQVKDFLGLKFTTSPIETVDKVKAIASSISTINYTALLIGILSLAILVIWPKFFKKIPSSLIAVVVCAAIVKIGNLNVVTIGNSVSSSLPTFHIPAVDYKTIRNILPDAFTIAILAAIESLLSCVVADGMIGSKHNSNMELVAQGVGNTASALFGGIPATGAIARTAANIKNGGRTPIAGMVHAVTLLIVLVVLMPYAALIPMPTIAAILFVVAYNMSGLKSCGHLLKSSPKSDIAVFVTTLVLTVVFDLVVAIVVGIVLACLLFMKRMADVTEVNSWVYVDENHKEQEEDDNEENDPEYIGYKEVPKNTLVYEITGPIFFGASEEFTNIVFSEKHDVLILRMRSVPAIDMTGMNSLVDLYKQCQKDHVTLVLSHVNEQPMRAMRKAGFDKMVGEENILVNIDAALARAKEIVKA
ncbi:MAG: SulP family inorganic anion transporter [bacterium]|nr:SulP family inorganic anion transporter [bacterium]